MYNLALRDEILLKVDKPARYIGGEVNSVKKDPEGKVRVAMCFPDVYEIGMSHLGIQILYDMFNQREDVYCERVYSPWMDLHKIMKEEDIPLFALESQDPIALFDFLCITIQYEMCYTNIVQILDLAKIGIFSKDRKEDAPIVIGGGPCVYNPEPIADFFDIIYIGEGETKYYELLDLYKEHKAAGGTRKEFLQKAARMEGLYVPAFYDVTYKEDGTVEKFFSIDENASLPIKKQVVMDLSDTFYPDKPVVPFIRATQDRCVLEIQRGCIRGCRFCQAGMIYRPNRERSLEMLKQKAVAMLESTGHEEISLSSLSSSDYSELEELTYFLIEEYKEKQRVNISLPSLRIDAFALDVMKRVQDVKKSSITFAPEAGTQRLRNVINKGLTKEDIIDGSVKAFKSGWNKLKFYFMLGLPTETEEDQKGIAQLCEDVAMTYYKLDKEDRNGRVAISASASFFVPKPFTPFQWATMCSIDEYNLRARRVKDTMMSMHNRKSLSLKWHDAKTTILEGILARGDRKVAAAIYDAYMDGCLFDSWTEFFDYNKWLQAFEKNGIDIDFYTVRPRDLDEVFPWDFIDCGVNKTYLKKEWQRAMAAEVTPNCRQNCNGCGAARYKGGICFEN